jgi:hypothetical protein
MRPVLRSGDWIGVEWLTGGAAIELRAGELLLGRARDDVWLVHRLVRKAADGAIVLKGDASTMTEALGPEGIWGKVVAIRREASGRPSPFRSSWLDGVIAALSRRRLRRAVFLLGWLRRAVL